MGSSSSSPLDIAAGVATGGIYTAAKYVNDKRLEAKRAIRTAADQQRDAMLAQENEMRKRQKEEKRSAQNVAIRQRLIATRGYNNPSTRGGTILTAPGGAPDNPLNIGTKRLLGY